MHAFFALPFDLNSYKNVFLWHFDNVKQNSIIVSLCVLELDEAAVWPYSRNIWKFNSVLIESTKLVCLFDYILLCSNLLVLSFGKRGSNSG